jgi:putative PIN family toxin of toxin-antitoxin system
VPKAVLDTNILVSAFITPRGTPAQLLEAWRAEQFDLITSPPILEELHEALSRPKLQRRYHLSLVDIGDYVTLLAHAAVVVPGTRTVSALLRDADDQLILAAAIESASDYLVTGDKELLHLKRFHAVRIITPSAFLKLMPFSKDPL